MKAEASTATKNQQKAEPDIPTLEQFGEDVMRRCAALGVPINMPRNSGKRRTESKKALLAAIEAAAGSGEGDKIPNLTAMFIPARILLLLQRGKLARLQFC